MTGLSCEPGSELSVGKCLWKTRASSVIPGNLSLREKSASLWLDLNMQAEFDFFPDFVIKV